MSRLIDTVVAQSHPQALIKGVWYVAKPLNDCRPYYLFRNRLRDAWQLIKGKAIAVHYYEDTL